MAHPSKLKGDRAERELERILADLLGFEVRRKLGAGRRDDMGDIDGLPNTVIQVTGNRDATKAFRLKPLECAEQQARAGALFGVTAVRLHGGIWRFVQTEDQFATLWREAQPL